jgi:signal transduction histidine kinase
VKPIIRISGEVVNGGWELHISDNGVGIEPHLVEAAFEPLNRLHGKGSSGTGLGLAICRTIVHRHGGRIWAESDGLNRGSTFRIFLPSTQQLQAPGAPRPVDAASSGL